MVTLFSIMDVFIIVRGRAVRMQWLITIIL